MSTNFRITACQNSKYFGFYRTCKIADLEPEMYLSSSFFLLLKTLCGSPRIFFFLMKLGQWKLVCLFLSTFPRGGFLDRADIPNSFGNRAFLNTQIAAHTTFAKHQLFYWILTRLCSTNVYKWCFYWNLIRYCLCILFRSFRNFQYCLKYNMFIFKALRLVIFPDVDMVWTTCCLSCLGPRDFVFSFLIE